MYELTRLNKFGQAFFYQGLTFPLLRPRLLTLKPEGSLVAIGASSAGRPVGLFLAEILSDKCSAKMLSVFVVPSHRRQGIATALLKRWEEELAPRGCTEAQLVDDSTTRSSLFVPEALLRKCHWILSNTELIYNSDSTTNIIQAPFLQKKYVLPADMEIFLWQEITSKERLVIEQTQSVKSWIKEQLYPFKHEESFEPLNSLGLRYQGEVVGWVLTKRLDVDTIAYNCMFVRKDLQRMGRGIALFVEAIKRQNMANIPKGIWEVNQKNDLMIRFINKYMLPYLTSIEEIRLFSKSLC
jgi:GNAT superfamily N-acetyltransferase